MKEREKFGSRLGFILVSAGCAVGLGNVWKFPYICGKSAAKAFEVLEPEGTNWHHFKWISILGSYLLMMFYTMVGGWMLYYAFRSLRGDFLKMETAEIGEAFSGMLARPGTMTFWMILAVVISFGACVLGLQKGIERITKVMMGILIVLIVVFLKGYYDMFVKLGTVYLIAWMGFAILLLAVIFGVAFYKKKSS